LAVQIVFFGLCFLLESFSFLTNRGFKIFLRFLELILKSVSFGQSPTKQCQKRACTLKGNGDALQCLKLKYTLRTLGKDGSRRVTHSCAS
jgi:hypothetical protein